ncbi:MAG: rhodanese-like domain-containing protein, partial [Chloroflexota bacterium]|nr:rhodanese-like domain-containing protein [Chloroflexota bacterium]
MPDQRAANMRGFSRRQTLHLGLGWAAGLALGGAFQASLAQTPVASPMDGAIYTFPEMLIDADRVAGLRSDPAAIVVGFMPDENFAEDHIPGSVQLDWPVLEVTDTSDESIARWREQISQTLGSLGIARDRPVIAYDAGTLFAARLWWILHYLGHEDKHVVNGGLAAWQQTVHETTTGATPAAAAASPAAGPFQAPPRADVLAQLDEVRASLDDPGVAIVDARTPEEYAAGHIPGAVNINYPCNALAETPMFWKPANELRAMYEEVGVTPDKRVIPYCSTGVRSAVTFFTLRLIGYQDVGLYTGSWKEWG